VEANDGDDLEQTSVHNRWTSTKSGIRAWKEADGTEVFSSW